MRFRQASVITKQISTTDEARNPPLNQRKGAVGILQEVAGDHAPNGQDGKLYKTSTGRTAIVGLVGKGV